MKRLLVLLPLVVALGFCAHSQKLVQKNLELRGKSVEMKLTFADTITVEAWGNNRIELQVSVNIEENRYNDYYELKVKDQGSNLVLEELVDFKAIHKQRGENQSLRTEIVYKLRVPSNLEFSLNTISGKVVLKGILGKMTVHAISGFIDYTVPSNCKAQLNLSTVSGNLYSDLKFDEKPGKDISWVGTKQKLSLNGGTMDIALKTVSGDIYLRKGR
jgi:hypothetical protein